MGILSHFNQQGEAQMVDISNKDITSRTAVAEGLIYMQAETLQHIKTGSHKKGDVLGIARIAGIMAAKKTSELIPLCHSLKLSHIEISFSIRTDQESICCRAHASATAKTGGRNGSPASGTNSTTDHLRYVQSCGARHDNKRH